MLKPEQRGVVRQGNDRFEGYVKDFVDILADSLGFKYNIQLVNDSRYGGYSEYNTSNVKSVWSGMIGELVRHEVHLVSYTQS